MTITMIFIVFGGILLFILLWLIRQKKQDFWEFINKPLTVVTIVSFFTVLFFFGFGNKEEMDCTLGIKVIEDVVKNKYGNETFEMFRKVYRNFTFDMGVKSYQEALAYKQLADDLNDKKWFKYYVDCGLDKKIYPVSPSDLIKSKLQ